MTNNRLIVLGSKRDVASFQESNWDRRLRTRYREMLEQSKGRYASQFTTEIPPIKVLTKLSRQWPRLTFLISYESGRTRVIGIVKAKAGELEEYEIKY